MAIAYSMGQIIKSVCVCQSVSVSVCPSASTLTEHFSIDFHQNWHRRKNPSIPLKVPPKIQLRDLGSAVSSPAGFLAEPKLTND